MNRPIKFRAWDSSLGGRMWSWDSENADFDLQRLLRDRSMPVMQFTGLHDKNGKEIWEGDLVKKEDRLPYKVVFDKGCFTVAPLGEDGKWYAASGLYLATFHGELEVIGNIYENPELLTDKGV